MTDIVSATASAITILSVITSSIKLISRTCVRYADSSKDAARLNSQVKLVQSVALQLGRFGDDILHQRLPLSDVDYSLIRQSLENAASHLHDVLHECNREDRDRSTRWQRA